MRDPEPVLPERTSDEVETGWGEPPTDGGRGSDDWYRAERPPHHGA